MILPSSSMSGAALGLMLAVASNPAYADGVPASHAARQVARGASLTTAVRKANDAGIVIQYRVEGAAQVGRSVSVFLQFDGVNDPAGATVRLATDAGLTLTTPSSLVLPVGQRTTTTATVTVHTEGLAYLNVFATQNGAMSIVAVPLQAGTDSSALKSVGEVKPSAEGEKVISMPASEPADVKAPARKP